MRPKSIQVSVSDTANSIQLGPSLKNVVITNAGSADVYVDFDNEVTTSTGYLIPAGGSLSGDLNFVRMYYMTASGTATLYLIKVTQ